MIPTGAHAHRIGRAILKERVGPGDAPRVVGVGAAIDGGAAGGVDNADVLLARLEGDGGHPHAQRGRFATTGARTSAAHIEQTAVGQHHVNQHAVADKAFRGVGQATEEVEGVTVLGHCLIFFFDHFQRVVTQVSADLDALGAAFALGRVDENAEIAAAARFLFLRHRVKLVGNSPLLAQPIGMTILSLQRQIQHRRLNHFAQNGRVRAFGDTGHTTDTVVMVKFGNFRRDIGKVAQHTRAGRNQRPGDANIGGQPIIIAFVIRAHDPLIKITRIGQQIQLKKRTGNIATSVTAAVALRRTIGPVRMTVCPRRGCHILINQKNGSSHLIKSPLERSVILNS